MLHQSTLLSQGAAGAPGALCCFSQDWTSASTCLTCYGPTAVTSIHVHSQTATAVGPLTRGASGHGCPALGRAAIGRQAHPLFLAQQSACCKITHNKNSTFSGTDAIRGAAAAHPRRAGPCSPGRPRTSWACSAAAGSPAASHGPVRVAGSSLTESVPTPTSAPRVQAASGAADCLARAGALAVLADLG